MVARANDHKDWINKLERMIGMIENHFEEYWDLKERAHINTIKNYNWEAVLQGLADNGESAEPRLSIA